MVLQTIFCRFWAHKQFAPILEIDIRMNEMNNKIQEESIRCENKSNELNNKMNEIEKVFIGQTFCHRL